MTLDLTAAEETITVLLADDDSLPFEINDAAGLTPSTSMAAVVFTLYILPNKYSANAAALITKADATITGRDNTAWTGAFPLTPEDKAALIVGTYWYRVHMLESGGADTTVLRGPLVVSG